MSRNEAKARKELVDPKLRKSGWFEYDRQMDPKYKITDECIHFDGNFTKGAKSINNIDGLLKEVC